MAYICTSKRANLVKKVHILWIVIGMASLVSCHYTKHVPQDQRLLWDQDIREKDDKSAIKGAESILKQQPNQKILWSMPKVTIYNWGNGQDSSFFSRIGEAPVILDSIKTRKGAEQLQYYYFNRGYFGAKTDYKISLYEKKRWARVDYYVTPGARFYLDTIETEVRSPKLRGLVNHFSSETVLKKGDPYDADQLDRERSRLVEIFRNHGYYNFSKSYISYKADTTLGNYKVYLKLIIDKKPFRSGDTILYKEHEKYRFNEVYIEPDYDFKNQSKPGDSMEYMSYVLAYDTLEYKPRYLTDAVHFKEGDIYRQKDVRETYSHLVGYQAFQITEIKLKEGPRDTAGPTLNAIIHLYPLPKYTFNIQPELTTTNGYGGLNMSLGGTWRNVFGAGEALDLKFSGGFDYQATAGDDVASQAIEVGGELSISFPRFLLPFNSVGLLPKRMRPRSKISLSANRTTRFEFDRESFGGRLSYFWNETRLKTHNVDLYDVTFAKLYEINPTFEGNLSEFQQLSFQSEFITATRYSFTYNGQLDERKVNHQYFKGIFEMAGTSIRLGKALAPQGENTDGSFDLVAGVPYYQYIRPELDYRFYWNFTEKLSWANRGYTGFILPYGNSAVRSDDGLNLLLPPFSKFFFMGGSNDLRAWPAYRLGPGTQPNTDYGEGRDTSFAIGTIKFLLSSEFRFPIYGYFEGAVFVDAGNIWLSGGLEQVVPGSGFNISDLVNDLAVGSGFGLRLNLSYFVLRADIGIKLRDPGLAGRGSPWVITDRAGQPANWTYNIALGYPF